MTPTDAIANLKLLEGGFGHEADGQEVEEGIDQSSWDAFCAHRGIPSFPVSGLSVDDIQSFYLHEYLLPLKFADLPDGVDFVLFQWAVNHGITGAVKDFQICLGVAPDGVIGPDTLRAAHNADRLRTMELMLDRQMGWYEWDARKNPDAPLSGWKSRIEKVRQIVGLTEEEQDVQRTRIEKTLESETSL